MQPGSSGPPGAQARLDRRARLHVGAQGALLVAGSPRRALRLSAGGTHAVQRWRSGWDQVDAAELRLARRLHTIGALHLDEPVSWSRDDVTVVVPVRDRPAALDLCLEALRGCRVVVVDDGSVDRVLAPSATVLRHARSRGPAAARNTGLAAVRTPLVAFVDSDCVVPAGWLEPLLAALHGDVAAVAPRVVGAGGTGVLARYERGHGPLDLGAEPAPVRPRSRVGHVPAAVLLCRRAELGEGFDAGLRTGEDVDLVWRLVAGGRQVRYVPDVVVRHATRDSLLAWCRQRSGYGASAAALDRRHPGEVAPAVLPWRFVPAVVALLAGRPALAGAAAAVATGASVVRLRRALPDAPGRRSEAARLAVEGAGAVATGLVAAAARAWSPVVLGLLLRPGRGRRWAVGVLAAHLLREGSARRPTVALPAWTALLLLDDLSYACGLWSGAIRQRRLRVLLPRTRG